MVETIWAIVPAVIAICLALWTKEVYISLLVGIVSGALFFTNFNILEATTTFFGLMGEKIYGGGWNANILIFLVSLGIMVALMNKSGASEAYGTWASKKIHSQRSAMFATIGLGALIFVDDYFNCLTVGAVMRPVTDKFKISRAKLAYLIDSTAAPICIIAPISSWAAAVGSSLPEGTTIDGFQLFLKTIPTNYYALLTIIMVLTLTFLKFDFGPMQRYNEKHLAELEENSHESVALKEGRAQISDLILPIAALVGFCILGMLYTGGLFEGQSIITAFAECDASVGLVLGSFAAIIFTFLLYVPRKIITYRAFADSLMEGFRAMAPALLILIFAWTLSGICGEDYLNAGGYVSSVLSESNIGTAILPAIFFVIALFLAFSTGTSWGTFAILVPIVITVFGGVESNLLVIAVSSVLAGAVCGDHISPISDTTIMASAGAQCDHIEHVSTQIPYALLVAAVSFLSFLIAGFSGLGWLGLLVGTVLLISILLFLKKKSLSSS